jgi:4-hydroxymandelate oxidase
MFDGLDLSKVTATYSASVNWEFVKLKRLRDTVTVKLLLKGIVTREDAQIAVRTWCGRPRHFESWRTR